MNISVAPPSWVQQLLEAASVCSVGRHCCYQLRLRVAASMALFIGLDLGQRVSAMYLRTYARHHTELLLLD